MEKNSRQLKNRSLTESFFFNCIKTLCSFVFPVVTFAYVSRILGVDGIGKVNFSKSYITYFSMIAMLGINQYGTREAAKIRDNIGELSSFVKEILIINFFSTIIAYTLLFFSFYLFPNIRNYETLIWINSISIALSSIGLEWLYQALEEYRYIAIRAVAFQFIALIMMFVLVKSREDVVAFAIVNLISTSGSLIINFFHARKYVNFKTVSILKIKRHIEPMMWLFAMAVSIELYTVLDTTMLGFLKGDKAVGLYTAAIKINRIVIAIINTLGIILIPRLSYYIGNNEKDKLKDLVIKGYNYVFMLSIPAAIGLFVLSDDIIMLFSGVEFTSAGLTMRIITPIVIFIPFSVMTNQQTLVPLGREKLIIQSTSIGAIANILCNSIFIPKLAEKGAAIGTIVAELAVAIVCFRNAHRFFDMKIIFKHYVQYWIAIIPIIGIGYLVKLIQLNCVIRVILVFVLGLISYSFVLMLFKNAFFICALEKMQKSFFKFGRV